ncbi:unnamed protein product [Bursaphelenchus okinawaensis]|uniref:Uncharacterized protein n=1 Tax=Bursaphelenchus okinawaensis TaxID=465554 RepID=A0A811JWW4_9BILA|nr:unnamed protein product [Bursaphelenchus okinawaensis]CAG9086012.1 unnamed protein product [Bursaphelenchus okinawaensis]
MLLKLVVLSLFSLQCWNILSAQEQQCTEEAAKRLFSCAVVLTEKYYEKPDYETVENLNFMLKSLNEHDYGKENCSKFWQLALCARSLSSCYGMIVQGSLLSNLHSSFAHAFGVCNGLSSNESVNVAYCYSFLGTTCTEDGNYYCRESYFSCLSGYVRRECVDLSPLGRQTLCYLIGYKSKKTCQYGSLCSTELWTEE